MDLREEVLKEHSKKNITRIVDWVGEDPQKFDQLMRLFLGDEYRITQRAAWVVGDCTVRYPELIKPHLKKIIGNLHKPIHEAVKRNTVRIFEVIDIPEEFKGEVLDICFQCLEDGKEAVAVKAYALTVCFNIAKEQPELLRELKILIEDQLPYAPASFRSRAVKMLRWMEKMKI